MRIHVVTSRATLPYFFYCVKNHASMAANPESLSFVAYCLDEQSAVEIEKSGIARVVRLPPGNSGSIAHMLGIRASFANMESGEINIIADSDTVILAKGWDYVLRQIMQECDVVGTIYEDIGGFSSGAGKSQTYKRVPNFTWCALTTKFPWDFDVSADKANTLPITTEDQSKAFNLPIGFELFREPCWKFPLYLYENGIKYYSLEFVRPTSGQAKAVLTGNDYHTEYTLADGTPFVAHQRGSMSKEFRKHPLSSTFYDACEAYIRA